MQSLASEIEFFVATSGEDTNPGTRQLPFASVQAAQQAVRNARQQSPDSAVTVTIAPGHYSLTQTWVLNHLDSGKSAEKGVRYRAELNPNGSFGEVILSGGRRIENWQPDPERPLLWRTRVADPDQDGDESAWRFEQLWVNGQRAIRARTPNHWEFQLLSGVAETPIEGSESRFKHTFSVAAGDLQSLQGLSDAEQKDVQVVVFHKWDTTREWLQEVKADTNVFTTTGGIMKHWNPMSRDCLYYFENYLAALDSPGEWFLDRDGWLYYYPRPSERIESIEAFAPELERLIDVQGSVTDPEQRVRNIRFEGLKLRHAEYRIPAEGLPPWQAAMNVDATAVHLDGAENIQFLDCAIEHVGTTGIWFRKACRDCRVERTRVFDLGVAGIRIGEEKLVPDAERTGGITVNNCILHSGGRIMASAVGVWIGHSADNAITHCDIADFFYTAVSVGWRWGYGESGAKRNKIEFNHLHHIGYRILSDMGGVYTLGPSEGTTVSNNVIHDVYSTRYGGWGLYPDEGSTQVVYENNLVYDVRDGCFHQHYGKENVIRNNIFAFSEEGQIAVTRAEPHLSFTFERNLVYWDQGTLLGYSGWNNGAKVEMNHNLYWQADGDSFDFGGKTLQQWRELGRDEDSIIADPLFVDPARRDFRLRPDSPATKLGFVPFDYSKAGVYGDDAWKRLATKTKFPEPYVVPKAKPISLNENFETESGLSLLGIATVQHEGRSDLVRVVESPDGFGHCLKVQDSPDLDKAYNPHFYLDPRYETGDAVMKFRIRLQPDADVTCEWRSKGHPYRVGPSVRFHNQAVWVAGRKLIDLRADHWCEVKISATHGQPDTVWAIELELPDGTRFEESELACDPQWKETRWLGFTSGAKNASAWYLDDLELQLSR